MIIVMTTSAVVVAGRNGNFEMEMNDCSVIHHESIDYWCVVCFVICGCMVITKFGLFVGTFIDCYIVTMNTQKKKKS